MARGTKKRQGITPLHIVIAIIAVAIIVLLANSSMFNSGQNVQVNATATPKASLSSPTPEPTVDYPPELYARLKQYQNTPDQVSKRPAYFGSITDEIFKELPAFPKDFYVIKLLFELGKITDPSKITLPYWKQPEFYPGFDSQGVPMMINPPQGRWGAFGYGTYPGEVVVLAKKSGTFETHFFVHTSWLVQTYQGIGLTYGFPAGASLIQNSFPDNIKNVKQDPAEVQKYFDVSVTPDTILLEPAFPVFKPGWAQMVTVKVTVKNPPSGKYAIGIFAGDPPTDVANEWLWKYKTNYVGGGAHSIGAAWYTIFVQA